MNTAKSAVTVALLAVACMVLAVVPSESSDAVEYVQEEDISVSMSSSHITVSPNASKAMYFDFKDNSTKNVVIYLSARDVPSGASVSYPQGNRILLDTGNIGSIQVMVSIGAVAGFTSADISFEIRIVDPDRGLPIYSNTPHLLTVSVAGMTDTSSKDKFLGIFDNNLPGFLGESWFAAIITFLFIVAVGYVVSFWAVPVIQKKMGGRR